MRQFLWLSSRPIPAKLDQALRGAFASHRMAQQRDEEWSGPILIDLNGLNIRTVLEEAKSNEENLTQSKVYVFWSDDHDLRWIVEYNCIKPYRWWTSQSVSDVHIREAWDAFDRARDLLFFRAAYEQSEIAKYKQLGLLTETLETEVEKRTSALAIQKKKLEQEGKFLRSLVRFSKELSNQHSVIDVLKLWEKELKPFHRVLDTIVHLSLSSVRQELIYRRGNAIHIHQTQTPEEATDKKDPRQFLANELARPVGRVLMLSQGSISVFIEHDCAPSEIESLVSFVNARLPLFAISLDKLRIQEKLRQVSLRWQRVFDNFVDPIAVIDLNHKLLRSNRRFHERPAKTCFRAFAGREELCESCPLSRSLESRQFTNAQIAVGNKTYEVNSYPIKWKEGEIPTTAVHHYTDLSAKAELYQNWIQHEKMVSLGTLAGHIAHELNNPLTGIRSLVQILLSEVPKEGNLWSDLNEIGKAAERCHHIIKNLLEFSGSADSRKEDLSDLNEAIAKTLPLLKSYTRLNNLEVILEENLPLAAINPHMMQQVLFNIVKNACQAMPDGGSIRIETKLSPSAADVLVIIADDGPGIPEEIRKKLFQPFLSTKKPGEGTGLGLRFSQTVMHRWGGKIDVLTGTGEFQADSRKGTKVILTIPRLKT